MKIYRFGKGNISKFLVGLAVMVTLTVMAKPEKPVVPSSQERVVVKTVDKIIEKVVIKERVVKVIKVVKAVEALPELPSIDFPMLESITMCEEPTNIAQVPDTIKHGMLEIPDVS